MVFMLVVKSNHQEEEPEESHPFFEPKIFYPEESK